MDRQPDVGSCMDRKPDVGSGMDRKPDGCSRRRLTEYTSCVCQMSRAQGLLLSSNFTRDTHLSPFGSSYSTSANLKPPDYRTLSIGWSYLEKSVTRHNCSTDWLLSLHYLNKHLSLPLPDGCFMGKSGCTSTGTLKSPHSLKDPTEVAFEAVMHQWKFINLLGEAAMGPTFGEIRERPTLWPTSTGFPHWFGCF